MLGDMLELGDSELVSHLDLGKEAAKTVDYLIGVGPASANTMRGAIQVRASIKENILQIRRRRPAKFRLCSSLATSFLSKARAA